jgi:hypothetical protein
VIVSKHEDSFLQLLKEVICISATSDLCPDSYERQSICNTRPEVLMMMGKSCSCFCEPGPHMWSSGQTS